VSKLSNRTAERTDLDAAAALQLADAAAMLAALAGITLDRQDVGVGELALRRHGDPHVSTSR
jgi:hypothetical protein